jgi:hypothetical protein
MDKILNGCELSKHLKKALSTAKTARFAVAFWGSGASEILGIKAKSNVKFKIVCNLLSGGTNPKEIRKMMDYDVEVRQLNDLHAKLGIIDNVSFLGSSNISTNGLGGDSGNAKWREANAVYDSAKQEIVEMFETFWDCAKAISDDDLKNADKAWNKRIRANAEINLNTVKDNSLIKALRSNPKEFDNLNVRMVVYDRMIDLSEIEEFKKAEKKIKKSHHENFSLYMDWTSKSMIQDSANSYLIDFDWPRKGKISYQGLYRRNTSEFKDCKNEGTAWQVVYKVKDLKGVQIKIDEDVIALQKAFYRYVEDGNLGEGINDDRTYNFPITDLIKYL